MSYEQNPQGQPPSHYPPPVAPQKKKSRVGLIIGIIVAVFVVLCGGTVACIAIVGKTVDNAANTTGGGAGSAAGNAVGLNQAARDGKFEFTVTKVECGKASLGQAPMDTKAQGQFCVVSMTVKNIGQEAKTFTSSDQHAYNAAGAKYDADGSATIFLDDANSFLNDINPGNSVNGILAFDIPKDAKIVRLELHDSSLSGGVTVNVA